MGRAPAVLVINAQAGTRSRHWEGRVLTYLLQHFDLQVLRTLGREKTIVELAQRVHPSVTTIIAGGDGSLNAALCAGIRGPIGILPLGTANDFAHALGLPTDPMAAAARIAGGRVVALDYLTVNQIPFCTVGGIGLGASVVRRVAGLRHSHRSLADALGAAIYLTSTIGRVFAGATGHSVKLLQRDGGVNADTCELTQSLGLSSLLISNTGNLAHFLHLCRTARIDDGRFEVTLTPDCQSWPLIKLLSKMCLGRQPAPGTQASARSLIIETDEPLDFFGDGETLATGKRFEVAIQPGRLAVLV